MPELKFKVTAKSESSARTLVNARGFSIIVDEPENLGGSNQGANPVEYMLAAFAGCLNVVGHMVANEMGFELKGINIELEGNLDPAKLMGEEVNTRAGYNEVRVKIIPETNADTRTLEKWIEIIEQRCPVSDNISNVTPVKITL